jgi:hypothetical protein
MSSKVSQRQFFRNLRVSGPNGDSLLRPGLGVTGGTGTSIERNARVMCHERVNLALVSALAITNAQKYNSFLALTFPNTNILLLGARLQLAIAISTTSGGTANVGTDFHFALGTVATASAAFSNAGEKAYLDSKTASGAAQALTLNANTVDNASPAVSFIAAGAANKIYLNVGTAATVDSSHAQTLAFGAGSMLDVFYYDLDAGA